MRITDSLIHHFLEYCAESFSHKIAVVHGKRRMEYSQINGLSNQLAHALLQAGVSSGDRVVILSENSVEYVFSYYGILKAGCIAVSLNTDLKPASLAGLLGELEPKVLIVSSKFEKTVRSVDLSRFRVSHLYIVNPSPSIPPVGCGVSSLQEGLAGQPDHNPGLLIDPKSCAAIIYTSGSAGKPKGVMLSHANIVANTRSIVEYLKLTPDDVQMAILPFFYVMGKSLLNTHFAVGGSVVINNQFAYTASVLKQMAEEGVTGFSGVPSTYAQLLFKSPLALYRDKMPRLRYCSQAGGHMPRHVKLELLRILPEHTELIVMYGATEASARLTYVPPETLRSKIDSIGKPIPGVVIKVLSAAGEVLKPGDVGELVASGENIMIGYYKDEESTQKALDEHGYHTGDLGWYDEDGYYYVVGRKDEQLKVAGHRLNPQEIEDIVIESGHAIECIVFLDPDSLLGHQLAGLVVPLQENSDALGAIMEYCRAKLPKYKVPASLKLVETIPKNSNGKPDRARSMEVFLKSVRKETGGHD